MEIKYTSTESDALALARFRSQYVPRVRRSLRIRHLGYSVGLALVSLGLCLVRAFFARTPTHTFVTVAQFPSVVVPNGQIIAGDLERFFDECVSRAQSART